MAALKVLILSDGRPGHFNLSEGITAALARRRAVAITRLEVHRRRFVSGQLAAGMIAAGFSPAAVLRLVHGMQPAQLPAADVIVSAGAETMPASIAAARLLGCPNIFYGSLRMFRPAWFGLVLTSYARQARDPHPVMTLKPSRLDPDTLPALEGAISKPPRAGGLLIGGDGGDTRFSEADWSALERLLWETHAAYGIRWIVSNSRRTPDAVSDRLAAVAGSAAIEIFIDVRRSGSGTLEQLFARSGLVMVTADSSSMLSEAVWSRRPVVALAPQRYGMTPMESTYRQWLESGGHCATLPLAGGTPEKLMQLMSGISPLPDNPLDALAGLLESRLPAVFAKR